MAVNPLRPSEAEAAAAWAALVDADAEQVARVREPEPPRDFYAATAARFRPGRRDSVELPVIERYVRPGDVFLDIGAGGGRFAVPVGERVARVLAVEPSEAMRGVLAASAADARRTNIEVFDTRWPDPAWTEAADVSVAAHSMYDIREILPFLDAMERHTRRTCITVFGERARGAQMAPLFEAVHGEPLATLPSLREFVAVLAARGRRFEVATVEGDRPSVLPLEDAAALARRLLWLAPGSPKEQRMRALLQEWWGTPDGIAMPPGRRWVGIVTWEPPRP